jgi:LacI family transcriptional regulator
MNEKRTTLADIAKRAGVHVTTVSLALRNHRRLPETTRQRIQDLAKEMGYVPDPLLRALVSYRGKVMERRNPPTVAYVTNWDTRWGWRKTTAHGSFYAGAERKAQELGFTLDHFWMREEGMTQQRLNSILTARGINGMILASHMLEFDDAMNFDWSRFSGVKIDYFPHHPALHTVTNDQLNIIRLAFRQVLAAGYRRIGFVMHRGWDHSADLNWSTGFISEQHGLPKADHVPMFIFPEAERVDEWIHDGKSEVIAPARTFNAWFRKYRPEIILSKASFVQPRFEELGLRVPRDVAFADLFLENADGSVAGVEQSHETVGELAVEILAGQLQHNKYGVPAVPTTTLVEGTWHDGSSCPPRKK